MAKSNRQKQSIRLIGLVFAQLALLLYAFGSVSLQMPAFVVIGSGLLLAAVVYGTFELAARRYTADADDQKYTLRFIAALDVIALGVCVMSAILSILLNPADDITGARFVFENTATAAGVASIILTVLLSTLQKDIYWFSRKKTVRFDERLIAMRRAIFEASYKAAAVLTAIFFLVSYVILTEAARIAHESNSISNEGHFHWITASMVIAIVALPLVIAAHKDN